jgi:hypothetical protein
MLPFSSGSKPLMVFTFPIASAGTYLAEPLSLAIKFIPSIESTNGSSVIFFKFAM